MSAFAIPVQYDAIDLNDTHFSMEVTAENSTSVVLQEAVYDAATGQLTTSLIFSAPPENLYIESGYDPYDRVRMNHYRAHDGIDPEVGITETSRSLRSTGSTFVQYDASGQPIPVQIPPDAVAFSPLTEIGPLEGVSILSGVIIDERSVDPNAPRPTGIASMDDPLSPANGAHRVDRTGDRLVITTFFPEGGSGEDHASAATTGAGNGHGKMVRSFRKQGTKFVLEMVEVTAEVLTPEATIRTRQGLHVRKVKWKENRAKDERRRTRREQAGVQAPRAPDPFTSGRLSTGKLVTPAYICPPDQTEGCEPPPPPPPPPPYEPGQNVVFQHGIFSGPSTWSRMDPWLSSEFKFGTKRIPDTGSESGLSVQAGRLKADLDNTGQNGFLFIGHSQGGLISRDAAQRYMIVGRPDMVHGVITIGTPHQGANLARNGKSAVDNALRSQANRLFGTCISKYVSVGCWIGDQITGRVIPVATQYALDQTVPASSDLRPGSPYITSLNVAQEPFTRVGIQSYANKRFVWMRLIGDYGSNPEDGAGGRNLARYTQWGYDGLWACGVVSIFVARPGWAAWCISKARALDDIDRTWDRLTAPGDRSDGVVQGASQVYPNAVRQYPIPKGDSHVGENKSNLTRDMLKSTFQNEFNVPRNY